jgi:hypothetical protein
MILSTDYFNLQSTLVCILIRLPTLVEKTSVAGNFWHQIKVEVDK